MTEGNKKMLKIFSGLGSLFLVLVIALSFKIYYAISTDQPVLRTDYYETGRRYDKYVKDHANTNNRQLKVAMFNAIKYPHIPVTGYLKVKQNKLDVQYLDQSGKGVADAKIVLKLGRRSTNEKDFRAVCKTNQKGQCNLEFEIVIKGFWEGSLTAQDGKGRFSLSGSFKAE